MTGTKPKILAIDDEENFVAVFKEYFEAREYDITAVSTGMEGVEKLENNGFDVVLVDLKMGGINGEDVIKRVRELNNKIRVIVISAFNDGGVTRKRLLDEGIFAFIEKPVSSLRDLETMVRNAYGKELGGNN